MDTIAGGAGDRGDVHVWRSLLHRDAVLQARGETAGATDGGALRAASRRDATSVGTGASQGEQRGPPGRAGPHIAPGARPLTAEELGECEGRDAAAFRRAALFAPRAVVAERGTSRINHWGQMKLALAALEAVAVWDEAGALRAEPPARPSSRLPARTEPGEPFARVALVYAGAAPCMWLGALRRLLRGATVVVVDPAPFALRHYLDADRVVACPAQLLRDRAGSYPREIRQRIPGGPAPPGRGAGRWRRRGPGGARAGGGAADDGPDGPDGSDDAAGAHADSMAGGEAGGEAAGQPFAPSVVEDDGAAAEALAAAVRAALAAPPAARGRLVVANCYFTDRVAAALAAAFAEGGASARLFMSDIRAGTTPAEIHDNMESQRRWTVAMRACASLKFRLPFLYESLAPLVDDFPAAAFPEVLAERMGSDPPRGCSMTAPADAHIRAAGDHPGICRGSIIAMRENLDPLVRLGLADPATLAARPYEYLAGRVMAQCFAGQHSTECRLVLEPPPTPDAQYPTAGYNYPLHEARMFRYNVFVRGGGYAAGDADRGVPERGAGVSERGAGVPEGERVDGMDACADCHAARALARRVVAGRAHRLAGSPWPTPAALLADLVATIAGAPYAGQPRGTRTFATRARPDD